MSKHKVNANFERGVLVTVICDRFLGSRAVTVLNQWFQSNRDYPYPDDERTDRLAREAGTEGRTVPIDRYYLPLFRYHAKTGEEMVREQARSQSDVLQAALPFSQSKTRATNCPFHSESDYF